MSDFYEVLGLTDQKCDQSEIRRAYKLAALQHHPDRNLDNADEAAELFEKAAKAYQVLSDSYTREQYDDELVQRKRRARKREAGEKRAAEKAEKVAEKDAADPSWKGMFRRMTTGVQSTAETLVGGLLPKQSADDIFRGFHTSHWNTTYQKKGEKEYKAEYGQQAALFTETAEDKWFRILMNRKKEAFKRGGGTFDKEGNWVAGAKALKGEKAAMQRDIRLDQLNKDYLARKEAERRYDREMRAYTQRQAQEAKRAAAEEKELERQMREQARVQETPEEREARLARWEAHKVKEALKHEARNKEFAEKKAQEILEEELAAQRRRLNLTAEERKEAEKLAWYKQRDEEIKEIVRQQKLAALAKAQARKDNAPKVVPKPVVGGAVAGGKADRERLGPLLAPPNIEAAVVVDKQYNSRAPPPPPTTTQQKEKPNPLPTKQEKICKFFATAKGCNRGIKCRDKHQQDVPASFSTARTSRPTTAVPVPKATAPQASPARRYLCASEGCFGRDTTQDAGDLQWYCGACSTSQRGMRPPIDEDDEDSDSDGPGESDDDSEDESEELSRLRDALDDYCDHFNTSTIARSKLFSLLRKQGISPGYRPAVIADGIYKGLLVQHDRVDTKFELTYTIHQDEPPPLEIKKMAPPAYRTPSPSVEDESDDGEDENLRRLEQVLRSYKKDSIVKSVLCNLLKGEGVSDYEARSWAIKDALAQGLLDRQPGRGDPTYSITLLGEEVATPPPMKIQPDCAQKKQYPNESASPLKKEKEATNKVAPPPVLCKFFKSKKGCRFGSKCRDLHEGLSQTKSQEEGSYRNAAAHNTPQVKPAAAASQAFVDPCIVSMSGTPGPRAQPAKGADSNLTNLLTSKLQLSGSNSTKPKKANNAAPVCKFFKKSGSCRFGVRCRDLHADPEETALAPPPPPPAPVVQRRSGVRVCASEDCEQAATAQDFGDKKWYCDSCFSD